jgi:hypothetical protein
VGECGAAQDVVRGDGRVVVVGVKLDAEFVVGGPARLKVAFGYIVLLLMHRLRCTASLREEGEGGVVTVSK